MKVLVTGGAGYIGSHTCVQLLKAGYEIGVVDNLSNGSREALRRVEKLSGASLEFFEKDILDTQALKKIFKKSKYDAVIHFAGLKAVGESVEKPLEYYHNNVTGSLSLLKAMRENNVRNIVFSSSATVYGDPLSVPIKEDFPLSATNPYGHSKLMIEEILRDLYVADNCWNIAILRYFNPVGAHPSGIIGEDPDGIPNNLVPYIAQVAIGKLDKLRIFGNDYPTPDGTGVRDYIHVEDLAEGHLRALKKLEEKPGIVTYNLGTGRGCSVMEMLKAYSKASGRDIPYEMVCRRPGDIASCYADVTKAAAELGWTARHDIDIMCRDSWNWQKKNPEGYKG